MKLVKTIFLFLILLTSLYHSLSFAQVSTMQALIPAGEFIMGTEEGTAMERPIHRVQMG